MSVLQKLKAVLPDEDESISRRTYECQECDTTFDSTKSPGRVMCEECLSTDVRIQE